MHFNETNQALNVFIQNAELLELGFPHLSELERGGLFDAIGMELPERFKSMSSINGLD